MKLLFASANPNKIKEISALIPPTIELIGLKDIGLTHEIPEPGLTIKENSYLKAIYVKDYLATNNLNYPVFADDSGLEVFSLKNAPGVHSAYYAGLPKNDEKNNLKLLGDLKNETKRQARFVTVITLLINNQTHYFEGEIKGTIAYEAKGTAGFGYDPLFIPQGYRSTFAELGQKVKNEISHRVMALRGLVEFLKS